MQIMRAMARITGMAAMLATSATMAASDPGSEAGWAALKRCAQQDGERARHACVDKLMTDTGLLTPQAREQEQQRAFGLPSSAPLSAPVVAPPPKVPVAAADAVPKPAIPPPTPPAGPVAPDRVEVQIASVASTHDGKLIITTTDGAVWRQTENLANPRLPEAGQTMIIRKGSLGAYLCTPPSKLSWRCARTR